MSKWRYGPDLQSKKSQQNPEHMSSCPIEPVLYDKYSGPHYSSTVDFLLRVASISDWDELRGQRVLDAGCGPGTSSKWILDLFPKIERIIAVDAHREVVDLANVLHPHEKIEYVVADIRDRTSLECWERTIPKVISTWYFQYIKNQREAFSNIHYLLKHQGEAAFLFEVHSTYYDALADMAKIPRWKPILLDVVDDYIPESHVKKLDRNYYIDVLEEVGFSVSWCKMEVMVHTIISDEECKGFLASFSTLWKKIPSELEDEFSNDFFQMFVERNGRTSNGRIRYRHTVINVIAKKSFEPFNAT